jgi:hypothetical protein
MNITDINFKIINLLHNDPGNYFSLYKEVYGDLKSLMSRWEWQYLKYPLAAETKIFTAIFDKKMIAATSRVPYPFNFMGKTYMLYYGLDSMVHPDFRSLGIMKSLYTQAMRDMPILFSRGTMPNMFQLLKKIGYSQVFPDTYLVRYLAPLRLVIKRLGFRYKQNDSEPVPEIIRFGFKSVMKFDKKLNNFLRIIESKFPAVVLKNSTYLNWRYIENPLKQYKIFMRGTDSEIKSVVILRKNGSEGKWVDFLYDPTDISEVENAIKFVISYFKTRRCDKITCWFTFQELRKQLKRHGFLDRGETPRFSVYSNKIDHVLLTNAQKMYITDGEGDLEFL